MKAIFLLIGSLLLIQPHRLQAQTSPVHPLKIIKGVYGGLSKPLTEYPGMSSADLKKMEVALSSPGLLASFNGQMQSPAEYWPPQPNGAANAGYYVQTIYKLITVYTKTGQVVSGPVRILDIFQNLPGASTSFVETHAALFYDDQAERWFLSEMTIRALHPYTNYFLIAVSSSSNPAGTWHTYSFQIGETRSAASYGVWGDAYYAADFAATNQNTGVMAFERAPMLTGDTARAIFLNIPWPFWGMDPVVNYGTFAPEGTPGLFISLNDTVESGTKQQIWLYGMHTDWANPANSTIGVVDKIDIEKTNNDINLGNFSVPQKGTSQKLKAVPGYFMHVPQYRNFGSYQSIVCCHTINLDTGQATYHAGIRWYELRKTGSSPWTARQQGTLASDSGHLWLGSISLNGDRTIGIGYTVSGTNTYPSIRYCGQSKTAYAQANSIMDYPEDTILSGRFSQEGSDRWGFESSMAVDASNDKTFWYTNEYIDSANNRATRIASLRFGKYPLVTTLPATDMTVSSATLNGTINPNGLASTWHFEWGTTTSYSDSSANVSAGSGNTVLPVNFDLGGLGFGITYHYRIVGENSEGRLEGNDMTVIPGAAVITTRPVSSVETTSAVSGGDITSDGGTAVTERGVCWGKSLNPSVGGKHTSDGQGIGSFISLLDSLERNTSYHVRAYATNTYGPWYGQDRTFSTLCGNYTLPFSESFNNPLLPNCWTIIDHAGNSQVWRVGKLTTGDPMPAFDGDYAYLDSESYGSLGVQYTDLVSPTINCSACINVSLSFKHFFKGDINSTAELAYSADGGLSWATLVTFRSTSTANPETYSSSVPDAAGKSGVMFRWTYQGAFSYYWAVDDILINGDPVNMLGVTPRKQNVDWGPASDIIFNVQSNTAWTAESNQPWVSVTPSGMGSGKLVASYEENTAHESRTADISVSLTGRPPVVVYLEQARSNLGIEEKPDSLISIYPNPSNGHIMLVPGKVPAKELNITVWDDHGRCILKRKLKDSNKYTLDLTTAAEGIYLIQVSTGTRTVAKKISIIR